MDDFSSCDCCESNPHVVDDFFWDHLLSGCVQIQENVLKSVVTLSYTVDNDELGMVEPDGVETGGFWIALNNSGVVEGWDCINDT